MRVLGSIGLVAFNGQETRRSKLELEGHERLLLIRKLRAISTDFPHEQAAITKLVDALESR